MSKFTTGFSDGDVLLAAELNAIGDWSSYTPTLTGWTQGNGTMSGAYLQIDKLVFFYLIFQMGTTSSASGEPTFTVPVNMETTTGHQEAISTTVRARAQDSDGSNYQEGPCYYVSTSTIKPVILKCDSTYIYGTGYSATIPFTWTTSDKIQISGWYRAA